MVNGYVENLLKRNFKKKVKVTLSLLVTFFITGTVVFAEENPYKVGSIEYHKWEAEKALKGTSFNGKGENTLQELNEKEDNGYKIIVTNDGENSVITIENVVDASNVKISNKYISNNILENLKNLDFNKTNLKDNFGIIEASNSKLENNYGIIMNTQTVLNNYGLILGQQKISENSYNYGLIQSSKLALQEISSNVTGYNYGILKATGTNRGQNISGNSFGYNYGIISVENAKAQVTNDSGSQGYNFGYIFAPSQGQYINKNGGNTYNYGVIYTINGQNILNDSTSSTAYNYGVVISDITKNNSSVFKGKVDDRGIIIYNQNYTMSNNSTGLKNGVILKTNNIDKLTGKVSAIIYDDQNNPYAVNLTNASDKNVNEVFKSNSDKTTSYIQNDIAEITGNLTENLSGKTLIGVVDKNAKDNTILYKFTGENGLVLNDTVITGYFQKAGVLLDVSNKKLVIGGGTVINAVEENFETDATAIQLGENGLLTIIGEGKVIGKIDGGTNDNTFVENISIQDNKKILDVTAEKLVLRNADNEEAILLEAGKNYTDVAYKEVNVKEMELNFTTGEDKENKIIIGENSEIGNINGTNSTKKINMEVENTEKIGNILLGKNNDTLILTNTSHEGIIDMGEGDNDILNMNFGNVSSKHEKEAGNTFDYKVNNTEKIVLNGKGWHIGENAELNAGNNNTKDGEKQNTELHIADNGELHVEMNNNFGKGDVTTSLDNLADDVKLSVTTGDNAKVKFVVGDKFDVSEKQFNVATNYDIEKADISSAVIFKAEKINKADVKLTVKEASEIVNSKGENLTNYKAIYDTVLGALSEHEDLRNAVNYQTTDTLVKMITSTDNQASALYTTGYAVTKDVTDTYMSVVEDFGRKACAGEWIAYGKYVNSDTEFDGRNASKGYDGDITGTVGMIEYGVNEKTSYGLVYGQGDTKVDINGGGKLDGNNRYIGGFMKHTTLNGIDLIVNAGYTQSDLELDLSSSAQVGNGHFNMITSGSSDSDALTFSLKGRKDYRLSDKLRVQPVAGVRYSLVNQDAVESRDANFRIDEQDVTIFEGSVGGNIIRDFELSSGKLSLKAGVEFVLTEVSKSDDGRYVLYGNDIKLVNEQDIADNRTEGHIGIDYEHENGVGVDAKYEMIWTDKGDNSRVTAGISYRF